MNPPDDTLHRVYLIDVGEPIKVFLTLMADYCDVDNTLTDTEVLLYAMNFLSIENNVAEAVDSMMSEIDNCCNYHRTQYNCDRIRSAVQAYMEHMHATFSEIKLYDDGLLAFNFYRWYDDGLPLFTHVLDTICDPDAISHVVQSEPLKLSNDRQRRLFEDFAERNRAYLTLSQKGQGLEDGLPF